MEQQNTPTTVVVAGATGNLGSRIVGRLLDRGAVVRALVRPGNDLSSSRLSTLSTHPHLDLQTADLADGPDGLVKHLEGASAVVSAVQGGPAVIIDGQRALLAAAERAGVGRMIPSDYSYDFQVVEPGYNDWLDLHAEANTAFEGSSVDRLSVLMGSFPEALLHPVHEILDREAGTFSFWGDDDQVVDLTTVDDTASFAAAAALDPRHFGPSIGFAGESLTMLELHAAAERGLGRSLELRRKGSVDDLLTEIRRRKESGVEQLHYVVLQYQWAMASGQGRITEPANADYPEIVPTTVEALLTAERTSGSVREGVSVGA